VRVPAPAPLMIFRRSEHAWRSCATSGPYWLDLFLLDLVECDLVAGAAVELGGARAFVRDHRLGVFERAAALEVGGDAEDALGARFALFPELLKISDIVSLHVPLDTTTPN
jgi:hypothetical protein